MNWFTKILALGLIALGLALPAQAEDVRTPVLRGVTMARMADGAVQIAIDMSAPATPKVFSLPAPDRLVVDLPLRHATVPLPTHGEGIVRGVRLGARPDGTTRLVVDLEGPADSSVPRLQTGGSQAARLLVIVRPARQARAQLAPFKDVEPPRSRSSASESSSNRGARTDRRVIVIDAGHGGHDPGASGAQGAREKAVVLAAALALRENLEARGGYHVVLTRDGDRFLKLQDRVAIARENRADLFISLHADSNPNPQARGASVYTLSERGEERAKDVMEAQDWDMDLGDAPRSAQVEKILVDLAQRETTNRSSEFAELLTDELERDTPLLNRSHRNAGFFVLLAPDVPAVLLEMGFLTNAQDEARLTDPKSRRRMMGAVADAIDVYFARPRDYAGH